MFIRHIKLQNWKNFKKAEAELTDRVFVVGPNASGKSNFLDAFRFLRDIATSKLEVAVGNRGGVSRLRSIHARNPPGIQIDIIIAEDDGRDRWSYSRDPAGFSPGQVKNDPFGRDFLMRMWMTPARTRDARLKKINQALKVAVPRLGELKVELDARGVFNVFVKKAAGRSSLVRIPETCLLTNR